MTKRARFTQADLSRVLKAVTDTGARDWRVDIAVDGTISIIVGTGSFSPNGRNPLDRLLDK